MANPQSAIRNPRSVIVWIGLGALGLAAFLTGLDLPLIGPDESRYAQVAREMYERGDWITPTLAGHPWFEKPPLLYWLEIISFNVFGVSEFAARLGAALCGLATVASLWILGRAVSTTRVFANYLALIAASTVSIVVFSHGASFDIVVTFTMTAALVSFFVFDEGERYGRKGRSIFPTSLILFYIFIGLSLLAKGLIGILFPFAIVAMYYVLGRRMPGRGFVISLVWGTILAAAIASVWYVPMYFRHGWTFVDEFFIQHHFARFTSNKYKHPQPFYFFLWVLPLMQLPWTPFLFASIWKNCRSFFAGREGVTPERRLSALSPLFLFSACWLTVPLVFFSFSGSKLPGYILPVVPAGVIASAVCLRGSVDKNKFWTYFSIGISAVMFCVFIIATLTIVPRFAGSESTKGLFLTAAERGYGSERVYSLHTISHNAEFYANKRLIREPGGAQKRFYGAVEVEADMRRTGLDRALVLVPLEYAFQLQSVPTLRVEFIRDNGELAIYAVSLP